MKKNAAATTFIPGGSTRRFVAAALIVLGLLAVHSSYDIPTVSADMTGFRNATAQAADTGGDGNGYETNPAQAFTDTNGEAEDRDSGTNTTLSCTDPGKDRHVYYNYGFPVPPNSRIDGIEVRIDALLNNPTGYICVQLSWDGGVSWTTALQTSNLSSAFATYTLGGAADTWGRSWSDDDFSDANFRLRVIDVANTASARFRLDWVGAQVHFTGTLSVDTTQVTFPAIMLSGSDQTLDTSPAPWRATDGRAGGAGWNVTITAGNFSAPTGTIPASNFKVQQLQAKVVTVSGNTAPVSQVTTYQALSSTIPLKLLSAAAGTDMGTYTFTPDFRLIVPASSTSGDYRASLNVSVNSGP